MPVRQPRFTPEEAARRGEEIYASAIGPLVEADNKGRYVAIDIETGTWEMDADENTVSARLLARVPDSQTCLTRVGYGCVRRFGAGRRMMQGIVTTTVERPFARLRPLRLNCCLPASANRTGKPFKRAYKAHCKGREGKRTVVLSTVVESLPPTARRWLCCPCVSVTKNRSPRWAAVLFLGGNGATFFMPNTGERNHERQHDRDPPDCEMTA